MGFVYNRRICIRRAPKQGGVGLQEAYSAETRAAETVLFKDLPASIQFRREGNQSAVKLPASGAKPTWDIMLPKRSVAAGKIQDRDFIEDDLGRRFMVLGDYVDSLGYNLRVERLEA